MIVDDYLEQLQEGWKTWAFIGLALTALIGADAYKQGRAKKIVEKHRREIETEFQKTLKVAIPQLHRIGINLHRVLTTKYKCYLKYWPDSYLKILNSWKTREFYIKELSRYANSMSIGTARKKKSIRSQYVFNPFERPPDDDVGDNLSTDSSFRSDLNDKFENPKVKAWEKMCFNPALNEFRKANIQANRLTTALIKRIETILLPYLKRG